MPIIPVHEDSVVDPNNNNNGFLVRSQLFQAVPVAKGQALADEYGIKFFETVSLTIFKFLREHGSCKLDGVTLFSYLYCSLVAEC